MIKSFKQYNEEKRKEVVFTFGRFNPPTVGHGKLLAKVAALAIGNNYRIYASQSNDKNKNPLEYKEKIGIMRKMFPKHGRNIIEDKNAKTALHIASTLYDQGYTKITMVVGSDRISEFTKLLNQYNGAQGRHGYYNFVDGIDVVSAGDRDPDADDVSGMSASKMRQAVTDGNFKEFIKGLPKEYGEDMTLFNLLRKRMGLKEMVTFRKHIQLPTISEKREQYINGQIFNIDDQAITESGELITIKERRSNYIIDSNNVKHFIEKLNPSYGKGLSKSTIDKRQAQFNKQAKMADDDPKAYKPAPGDARSKTKPSKYTLAYHKKYDEALEQGTDELVKAYKKITPLEEEIKGLKNKAEESGISYDILKKVYDRGMAAWKTGHRPGATPHQWAFARVNSFIVGGKTRETADADLWRQHLGKSESEFKTHWMYDPKTGEKKKVEKPEDHERLASKGWIHELINEETWEDGYKRRVVKTTKPEHLERGYTWRIKGKEDDKRTIKLYKSKPDFEEYKKQMQRVAGHEFGK